jgi:hypothetical protein
LRDATLYFSSTGAVANGAGEGLFVGRNAQGNTRRTVMGFDVAAAIPAGSTITGAALTLSLSPSNSVIVDIALHRLLADWTEGPTDPANEGQGAASQAGDVTWLHRTFPNVLWATPGGDFNATASATLPVGDTALYTWSGAGLVADVQSWLDNPSGNFGWLLRGGEGANSTAKRFDSRSFADAGLRPVLAITYIPSPGFGALALAAGAAAARRRRA